LIYEWKYSYIHNPATSFRSLPRLGTTAVAAIRTGRRIIGIELDPGLRYRSEDIDAELAQTSLFMSTTATVKPSQARLSK
jgi:hypothetical protein